MRILLTLCSLLLLSGAAIPLASQTVRLAGTVRNAADNTPLPFATVRIDGSNKGTTTDRNGIFSLHLQQGTYTVVTSFIGFESARKTFRLTADETNVSIALSPGQIEMPVFTVTPGDNPALGIIRHAIESKERRKEKLQNYRLTSHSKLVVKARDIKGLNLNGMTDTAFTAVLETQTDAWWAKPNRQKEVVKARKQTAFIPAQSNIMISSFFIIDFSQDLLRLSDKALIVGPISEAGLRNYEYTLAGTTVMDGEKVYRIDIAPRSEHDPLLQGSLYISDGTFALTEIDVSLNDAAIPTFFKRLRFRQHFRLFERQFWMPVDVVVDAELSLSMIVRISMDLEGFSVLQDYGINEQINEEQFDRTRIKVLKEADQRDSLFWAGNQKIPNSAEELEAYRRSDSLRSTMEANRNLFGIGDLLFGKTFQRDESRWTIPGLATLYRFNRVEGNSVHLTFETRKPFSWLDAADLETGYGFSDHRWKYSAGVRFRVDGQPGITLTGRFRDILGFIDEEHPVLSSFGTTIASLFTKYDEKDYFSVRGARLSLSSDVWYLFPSTITFSHDTYTSVVKHTDWSFVRQSWEYRDNPAVNDGTINTIQLISSFDNRDLIDNAGIVRRIGGRSLVPRIEVIYNSASLNTRTYSFLLFSLSLNGSVSHGRFGVSAFRLAATFTNGDIPTQRLLLLPGSVNHLVDRWRFRTLAQREFGGDRIATIMVEHDFGDQLFRWFHIPFLQSSSLSLILFGNAGWSSMREGTAALQVVPVIPAIRPFYEVGIGIDRILLALRLEAGWRLNHYRPGRNFFVGISTPFLF